VEAPVVVVTFTGRVQAEDIVPLLCRWATPRSAQVEWPGWLRGRCFVDRTDPCRFVIYQEWTGQYAWKRWFRTIARQRALRALATLMESELQIAVEED
jgi:quinol monooxygenase YgiN